MHEELLRETLHIGTHILYVTNNFSDKSTHFPDIILKNLKVNDGINFYTGINFYSMVYISFKRSFLWNELPVFKTIFHTGIF